MRVTLSIAVALAALAGPGVCQEEVGTVAAVACEAGLAILRVSGVTVGDYLLVVRDEEPVAELIVNKVISDKAAEAAITPREAALLLRKGDRVFRPGPPEGSDQPLPSPEITPEMRTRSQRILGELSEKAADIRDFAATAAMDVQENGQRRKHTLQVQAVLPKCYRIVSTLRDESARRETDVVFDGSTQWVATTTEGKTEIVRYDIAEVDDALSELLPQGTSYADLRNPVRQMLFTRATIDSYRRDYNLVVLDTTTLQTRSAYLVQALPKPGATVAADVARLLFGDSVSAIKFWVGTVDGVVYRSQVLSSGGQVLQWQEISATKLNVGLKAEAFTYKPEAGVEVQDRTEQLIRQEMERLSGLAARD